MSILMIVAAILAGIVQSWADFVIILALFVINGAVQFGEEYQAGNAVAALREQLALGSRTLRNGKWGMVDARLLVPGDTIRVKVGDIVPADARLMIGDGLIVDQAALTGESLPVDRNVGDTLLSSATVKHGDMKAVVSKTGENTFFGRAATLVGQDRPPGRIELLVTNIARFLIVLTLLLVVVVIAVGASQPLTGTQTLKDKAFEVLEFATLVTISGIPLGLNAVLSVTMAVGIRVMARNKVIVSRMTAIEDLAGTDILCSDKTGTLTKNELTLGEPLVYAPYTNEDIQLYAALASQIDDGDVIDTAIGKWLPDHEVLKPFTTTKFIPFDAIIKRAEAQVRHADGRELRVTKGAVHKIEKMISDGTADATIKALVADMTRMTDEQAQKGVRCLAIAIAEHRNDWRPVGLLTLFDPPRDDAADTIRQVNEYGVGVKMITGDTVAIGRETARRLCMKDTILKADHLDGIEVMDRVAQTQRANAFCSCCNKAPEVDDKSQQKEHHNVVQQQLHDMESGKPKKYQPPVDVEKITDTVEEASGFAQMLPEHKYIVVDLLQARGHIVAMTGDGVNDAPALKRADVGIAVSGATDAARMAASLVLQEPGLAVIVEAIRESRRIFARMESYVMYRINATLELLFFLVLAACIFDFKISGIQIVLLVLVNDITVMLIAIDRVTVRPTPQHWDLKYLVSIASFIGAFSIAIVMATLVVLRNYYFIPTSVLTTTCFLQLSITDQLTIVSTRTRGLCFLSMPHWLLLVACILTQLLFTLFALYGVLMPAMPGWLVGLIWGLGVAGILIKDLAKIGMMFMLDRIFHKGHASCVEQ
eukprot:TRINITY_DN9172_c0_g1_i2.p1 TRINITY_DN9172_c0_g1~~TRINITY_DN9172_c0_g1_i2.p1  ORF type:complete len:822 (+),score=254.53 TRINITY_DN9172_c0_g1_i2:736-3201(+)